MKTDVITVSAKGGRMEKALEQVDKVIAYKELTGKKALHLRLLAEEMMGLMRSVTGEPEGSFWIEEEDGEYTLHLCVRTFMDPEKKQKLLSVSSTGKNESARGIMGRLREFFDFGAEADGAYAGPMFLPDVYEHSSSPMLDWEWSMTRYEGSLYTRVQQGDAAAKEAWDELEKSVVKHVADDVKVFIRSGNVELVILKKLA